MKYLLDTNIISELVAKYPNENVVSFIKSKDETEFYLSVITIGEIKTGIEMSLDIQKKEKLAFWLQNDLLDRFQSRIINIDVEIMLKWGEINYKLKSIGKPMPIMDSLIAAICLAKKFILVTRNEKDFKSLNIDILNPFEDNSK